jgi:hypothetical protein
MRPKDTALAAQLNSALTLFSTQVHSLPGIALKNRRAAFIEQLLESIHRIKYIDLVEQRNIAPARTDPASVLFDPIKASIFHKRIGNTDEAFWLIFIFVHFGKHANTGYRLAREVYGRLGGSWHWDWAHTSANPKAFTKWLTDNKDGLSSGKFGNHRKYESLKPEGTGAVVQSYVDWVRPYKSHAALFDSALESTGNDSRKAFDVLYNAMNVFRFGRTARFDYLTMVGKTRLAPIEPGSPYIQASTGPIKGARLLFGSASATPTHLNTLVAQLESYLKVPFGMQVLEDALCNWQKSPDAFEAFRG